MKPEFIVEEIQNNSVLPYVFDDESQAYAKFYTIMAAASVSDVPYHGAFILKLNEQTISIIEGRIFDRRTNEE